jgi:hypothetical protein
MIESDEWSVFDGVGKLTPRNTKVSQNHYNIAEQYVLLLDQVEALLEKREALEDEISRWFAETEGVQEKHFDNYTVECSRTARWNWDRDILADMFADKDMPDFVTQRLSVDKRKFLNLPASEQVDLLPALTKTLAKAKLKVKKNV